MADLHQPPCDLVAFLVARASDREALAQKMLTEARRVQQAMGAPYMPGRYVPGWHSWPEIEQMAGMVLREAAAMRAIVAEHDDQHECPGGGGSPAPCTWPYQGCRVLRHLAAIDGTHPGYQQRWAP